MSKNCQNCNAVMADNMNFCPSCRTKQTIVSKPNKSIEPKTKTVGFSLEKRVKYIVLGVVLSQISLFVLNNYANIDFGYFYFPILYILLIAIPVIAFVFFAILYCIIAKSNKPMPWGEPRNLTSKMWVYLIFPIIIGIFLIIFNHINLCKFFMQS